MIPVKEDIGNSLFCTKVRHGIRNIFLIYVPIIVTDCNKNKFINDTDDLCETRNNRKFNYFISHTRWC